MHQSSILTIILKTRPLTAIFWPLFIFIFYLPSPIYADSKPNLVFFLSDDHGRFDTGCYGNSKVPTSNIDRLAAQGMRFTNAFTPTAMCSPSRSAAYTGLYPYRNGAHANHSEVKPEIHSIPHYLKPLGYRVILAGKTHIGPDFAFPFEYIEEFEVQKVLSRHEKDKPFCLIIASNDPHAPYKKGKKYDVEVPPWLLDTPIGRHTLLRYYNSVESMDNFLGNTMKILRDLNIEDNTILIYASDHGAQLPFSKWTLYDAGINVPFIVRWPNKVKPHSVSQAMISFVDILPTLVEIAGGSKPENIDGKSFLPVLLGEKKEHHEYVFGTHTNQRIISGNFYPSRCIRTKTYKYIVNLAAPEQTFSNLFIKSKKGRSPSVIWEEWRNFAKQDSVAKARVYLYQHRPPVELYHLKNDPYELNNLAQYPEHKELIEELHQKLQLWMQQQNDPLIKLIRK